MANSLKGCGVAEMVPLSYCTLNCPSFISHFLETPWMSYQQILHSFAQSLRHEWS